MVVPMPEGGVMKTGVWCDRCERKARAAHAARLEVGLLGEVKA
jgi:hypothetical protein